MPECGPVAGHIVLIKAGSHAGHAAAAARNIKRESEL
jgi:hypothetical protein